MAIDRSRVNVRLTGSGGQGIALAATVLAESALACGFHATLIQEHGPEARGGATRSDLSVSQSAIPNPQFQLPDLCLVLSDKAWDRFATRLVGRDDVGLIVDTDRVALSGVADTHIGGIVAMSFEEAAKVRIGSKVVTNMICAAALARLLGAISVGSLSEVTEMRSPPAFKEKNRQAVKLGWRMMEEYLDSHTLPWRVPSHEVGKLAVGVGGAATAGKEGADAGALTA
ncbi:MAG: hypothetical protein EPN30_10125 [Actinomycetota bacterium]|nr:MAG: hypothetical protein EPN30_10125 [Actinomycetota bacterium]